jgi:hypothetical protein
LGKTQNPKENSTGPPCVVATPEKNTAPDVAQPIFGKILDTETESLPASLVTSIDALKIMRSAAKT